MRFLFKRYLAVVYESLSMVALALMLTAIYYMLFGDASHGGKRLGLQLLVWVGMGTYFVRCWTVTGQTLASQAWKLKVVNQQGQLLTWQPAVLRYIVASVLLLPVGLTLWWAIIDRDQQFLHDRLLGSRVVRLSL